MHRNTNRNPGFTLIELLVVISIIALLVSILLPALGSARQSAVMLQCSAQQRSAGQAVHMYMADNSEHYPYYMWGAGASDSGTPMDKLLRYLGQDDSLNYFNGNTRPEVHCPSAWDEATKGSGDSNGWAMFGWNPHLMPYGETAGAKFTVSGFHWPQYAGVPIKEANISETSSTGMLVDARRPSWYVLGTDPRWSTTSRLLAPHFGEYTTFDSSNPTDVDPLGPGRTTMTFADGHAGNYAKEDFDAAASDTFDRWKLK